VLSDHSDLDAAKREGGGWLGGEIEELRDRLSAAAVRRDVARGVALFGAGDPPSGLWRVLNGAVNLVIRNGQDEIAVYRLGVGACLGEEASLSNTPHPFGARAAMDSVASVVAPSALRAILSERPDWYPAFYRLARRNLLTLLRARVEVAALPSDRRLARRLLALADAGGVVRASKTELADFLGLTRVTVQRLLKDLADAGAIESRYRRVVVRDGEALRRIAEEGGA
jgi:CRP-like cAMP-binding protein